MQSPFAIFRKHQKVMTVVLTGLAMFAFIILGQIDAMPQLFGPIMGFVLGAALFWALSGKSGTEGIGYAMVGGVLGLVMLMFVIPRFFPDTSGVMLRNRENLSPQQIQGLIDKRSRANQFLSLAFANSVGLDEAGRAAPPDGFGYRLADRRRDIILGYLLNMKADDLGIIVSDKVVSAFIKEEVTQNKMSGNSFRKILRKLGLSEKQLYDDLRYELRARIVRDILEPFALEEKVPEMFGSFAGQRAFPHPDPLLPDQLWEYYRKLNVTQEMYVTPFPVESFVDVSATPDDTELQKFFQQYKARVPNVNPLNQPAPGAPGFRQPRRISIGYFVADLQETDDEIREGLEKETLTKKEITDFLSSHDEAILVLESDIAEQLQNSELTKEQATEKIAEQKVSVELLKAALNAKGPINTLDYKVLAQYEKRKARDFVIPEEPAAQPPLEPDPPPLPVDNPDEPEPGKKTEEKPAKSGTEDKKPIKTPKPDKKEEKSSQLSDSPNLKYVALVDESKAADSKEKPKATTASEKKPGGKPAAEESGQPKPPAPDENPFEEPAKKKPPKYRPLDDELKDTLKDELIRIRVGKKMEDRIDEAHKEMSRVQKEYFKDANDALNESRNSDDPVLSKATPPKPPKLGLTPKQRLEKMQQYAKENKLKYVELEALGAQELFDLAEKAKTGVAAGASTSDDYLIGQANRLLSREAMLDVLFGQQQLLLYIDYKAENESAGKLYAYWPLEDIKSHVPKLTDPGVKEQVIEAWRIQQARPDAKKRADEVAELVTSEKLFEPLLALTVEHMKTVLVARGMDKAMNGQDMLDWLKGEVDKQQGVTPSEDSPEKPVEKEDAKSTKDKSTEKTDKKTDKKPAEKTEEKPEVKKPEAEKKKSTAEPEEKTDPKDKDDEELEGLSLVYSNLLYFLDVDESQFQLSHPGSSQILVNWLEESLKNSKADAATQAEFNKVKTALTITGKPDGKLIPFLLSPSFSWLSQTRSRFGAPNVFASRPAHIDKPSNELMKYIFDELKNTETGVTPNADLSSFYVVTVFNRTPVTEDQAQEQRDRFVMEGMNQSNMFISVFPSITIQEQNRGNFAWVEKLEKDMLVPEPVSLLSPQP